MTIRLDVSVENNVFNDAQRVTENDLKLEQNRNTLIDAAIINNHFGSGILSNSPIKAILFDSDNLSSSQASLLAAGNFDGTGLTPHQQPSDINLGNQLEVELTNSSVFGRLSTKVAIIGLSFDGTLQMDRFYFYRNGKQVTSKHYKKILAIFFNDFKGNSFCSRNLGGRITIKETSSFQLSVDPIMLAQDLEPDIFWRDWKVSTLNTSLNGSIQDGIGNEYSVDGLEINITGLDNKILAANDVTSHIGQKFKAKTNNIQKITLLLGVSKNNSNLSTQYDWAGDLVISIYALQTTTSCPTDIIPELEIDFDPANEPLAQLSFSQNTLKDLGYVLTDVLQPVDFVFNNTKIAYPNTSKIFKDQYYAITLRRSGSNTQGEILIGCGRDRLEDSRITLFNGTWVDLPEEDLWFQVWTDAVKVADGQGYDAGKGIALSKTLIEKNTGLVIDNEARFYSLSETGENTLNTAILEAIEEPSFQVQDERTGSPIWKKKKFVPKISLINNSDLSALQSVTEPLMIGAVQDTNPKQNDTLVKIQNLPGLAKNDTFCIVNPDADLLSLNLLGSKLYPNQLQNLSNYRIFKTTLCTDGYGDVNGDGIIDSDDVARASVLIGESIYLSSTQLKILHGEIDTLELLRADVNGDGYVTADDIDLLNSYVNKTINSFPVGSSFTHLCLQVQNNVGRYDGYFDCDGLIRLDGYTGNNLISPNDLSSYDLLYDGYFATPQLQNVIGYDTIPFVALTYQIVPQPYWQPYLLALTTDVRLVPASFTYSETIIPPVMETPLTFKCQDKNQITPDYNPGRNDIFLPDNLILGKGEIYRPDGSNYKIDFEIGTVIMELPREPFTESIINIFDKFVADRGDGFTRAGYSAMRYADYATVKSSDLALNKVRFSVSIHSFVPNYDGYRDGYISLAEEIIGINLDPSTGILKLSIKDLALNEIFLSLVTKLQILVYLKKGGWNNNILKVNSTEVAGLIST